MSSFDTAFDRLFKNEGGYVDNPQDPGGETNYGVTWPVLHQAIGAGIVPEDTTIKTLTPALAKAIFLALFWKPLHAEELPKGVGYQLADWAYNSGIGTAIRGYQSALGVAPDGDFGPHSLAASKALRADQQISLLLAERLDFFRKLKKWPEFGDGWTGRVANDLRFAAQDEAA